MASRFKSLNLALIDEGRFQKQMDGDLRDLQKVLIEFVRKHGANARKAKAKLSVEITLTCVSPEDEHFAIAAKSKTSVPNRPANVTLAMAEEDDEDHMPALFVRSSGSTDASPKQGVLATKDGRGVNPETGEVIE